MTLSNPRVSYGDRLAQVRAVAARRLVSASVFAFPLAAVLSLWLVFLQHLEAGPLSSDSSLLATWLRDSTLSFPAALVAVAVALAAADRVRRRLPAEFARLESIFLAAFVAVAGSATLAVGRTLLAGEASRLPFAVHLGRDFVLAFAVALPLSGILATMAPREPLLLVRPRRRHALALVLIGAAALATVSGSAVSAASGPGTPCPSGAPVKSFDVQAIDVDITLNRFGDHDPAGKMYVLSNRVSDVRANEHAPLPNRVSIGLGNDVIQPLVLRANEGDCVEIKFANNASGGDFGVHLDGLSFDVTSSGDAVGQNGSSAVAQGGSATYRYYVPDDPRLEGAHYLRPGPGNRDAVSHGLFGVLNVEPRDSQYLNLETGQPLESGWEASIVPGNGKKAFREYTQIYHEIGNEKTEIFDVNNVPLPTVDPFTEAYRPGARAMNYRSEPFMNRVRVNPDEDALGYGSYTFGDPATPMMRGYQADPTKIRLVHGGSEMFHVFHLHGGGIRWRFNPLADHTYDYQDTGLNKFPKEQSASARLDSQAFGPGETYNLEIEGGAGGVQQGNGDFLYHCHIASHYVAGMWSFWRVYSTKQADLATLPDRHAKPDAVDSAGLIGHTYGNTTITKDNLDDWIRPQLPPPGVRKGVEDASVWDWTIDKSDPNNPVYLGETEDKGPWPDLPNRDPAHPGAFVGDRFVGDRPVIQFNPDNGRPSYPLMRPHIGKRPPFSPNGHSGAPWLGENVDAASTTPPGVVDPYAGRADGLCPQGSTTRKFNVVAINLPIRNTKTAVDPNGMIFVLAQNKAGTYAGTKPAEPLAIRTDIGECDAVTLTNEIPDASAANGFSKVNMHIHHVQFDTQASDGVITGMSFEQSVRPYKTNDPELTADASTGDTVLHLASVAKFQNGVWIGVGLGTNTIEVRQIISIDSAASTVTLNKPLSRNHPAGEWAGVEFTQYRWYPDVQLDNIFWHDHVDGIHSWGHGLVGQLIVEPRGATFHDPKTGDPVDSGTIVDIHTAPGDELAPAIFSGSFREMALWTIDDNPNTDGTLNLKAEPWADRLAENPDQSLVLSSYTHGDPITPLPEAYLGDPFVIRTINVGPTVDALHIDGHRFFYENRFTDSSGKLLSSPIDTVTYGISERYTAILRGGAGGEQHRAGDYLYMNSVGRHFRQGAWGIIRVLPGLTDGLQPLPGTNPGPGQALPAQTGGRPPAASGAGDPCPATAATRTFNVSAVDMKTSGEGDSHGRRAAYVPSAVAASAEAGTLNPQPLVLHVAAGECVQVNFTNRRTIRSSFHVPKLLHTVDSSGVDVGYNPENTVAPGGSRTYRFYADSANVETAMISDMGGPVVAPVTLADGSQVFPVNNDPALDGMYGAVEVAPAGASFTDPVGGGPKDVGTQVDVHLPDGSAYRDFSLLMADQDERIGQSHMPYPTDVDGPALINYRTADMRADTSAPVRTGFDGADPPTPILRAYAGDAMRVHAIVAAGSDQIHVFNMGGFSWPQDPAIPNAEEFESRGLAPWASVDAHVAGGAGGRDHAVGDFFYGDLRRPFTMAGMWGLTRVLPVPANCNDPSAPIVPLDCAVPAPVPVASVTPASLAFGDQVVNTTSASKTVTVTNSGNAPLTVNSLSIAGLDFTVAANTCLAVPIAAGASCTVDVAFTPQATGGRSSTLQIADNASGSPHGVDLSGNGVAAPAPAVSLAPTSLTFADRQVGTGASASQLVTVTNSGTAALNFVNVTIGGTNPGEFTVASNSCIGSLAAGANCTIGVAFAPSATGGRSASLQIADDAVGSPQVVSLSGNGLAAPAAAVYVLGNQAVEAKLDSNAPGLAEAFKTTAANGGSVTELRVYVDTGSTATSLVAGLYANNSSTGRPGALLTSGSLAAPVAGQFNTVTVPAASVSAGTTYWIAILGPSGTLKFRDRGAVGTANSVVSSQTTLSNLPATWSSGAAFTDGALSAWAAGTLSATPPPPTPAPGLSVLVGNGATEAKIDSNAAGMAEAFKTTAASSGSVTRLRVFVDAGSTAGSVVVGLYSNNAGHPGSLLASGTIAAPAAGQNNEVSVPSTTVTAGQTYWIAVLGPSGTLKFRDRGSVGAGNSETSQQTTLSSLPATWTTGTSFADGMLSAVGLG